MAKKIINVGSSANAGNGDPLRSAFSKINDNFTELYTALGEESYLPVQTGNGGKFLTTNGSNLSWSHVPKSVANSTAPSTPNSGDLWWDTNSGRLYVYYGTSWVDASPVDGVGNIIDLSAVGQSILPNTNLTYDLGSPEKRWRDIYLSGNTIDLGGTLINSDGNGGLSVPGGITSNGTLEFADGLTIVDGVIGKSSTTVISEEIPGGTISETTTIESQIEIATTGIVIAKRTRVIVDDAVTTTTDEAGTTLTVNNSTASIKHYVEPDGPNNGGYFQVSTSNSGAILEGVNETLNGTDYGRVVAVQNAVTVNTSVDGVAKYWLFDYLGGLTLPAPTSQVFTLTFDTSHYTPSIGKPSLTLTGEPWELEGQIIYEHNGDAVLQLTNIWPIPTNPGYSSGDTFTFSTLVHGLSDYILTITLNDVVFTGGVHWTANVGASQLPAYPSSISANGAIKLTAGNESFILGSDGSLTLPPAGTLSTGTINFNGTLQVGPQSITQTQYQFEAIVDEGGPSPIYYSRLSLPNIAEIFAGEDLSLSTWGSSLNIKTRNPDPFTDYTWAFRNDGTLTAPGAIQWDLNANSPGLTDITINKVGDNLAISTDVVLGPSTWTFTKTGNLNLPGGAVIDTYGDGASTETVFWGAPGKTIAVRSMIDENSYGGGIDIRTNGQTAIFAQGEGGSAGWAFNEDGNLTLPGEITSLSNNFNDGFNLNVVASNNQGTVTLNFNRNGVLTFPDGSTYNNSTLTGAVDSDLSLEVKHITTVSAEAFHGGINDLIFDISENDDITVVGPGWELNVGSELAPIWATVAQASINQSGDYEIIFSENYNFEDFTTWTFRNPLPESKSWTIRSQTGGILGPGGVVITNETAPLGGGDTYRELAFELPAPGVLFNEQRWVFANNGNLTLPQYNQIASVGSNATISLNGVGSNESIIELATRVDGETITSSFGMHPAFGIDLTSVRDVNITAGYDSATFKYDAWQTAEQDWTDIRDQDAAAIAPGTRTWAGLPSYQAYDILMAFLMDPPLGEILPPDNMPVLASIAKAAYELWQVEQAAINVTVSAKDKTWTFGNNGTLTLPNSGSIKSTDVTIKSVSPTNPLATKDWVFDGIGRITFPNNTVQTTAFTGSATSLVGGVHSVTVDSGLGMLNIPREVYFLGDGSFPGIITWETADPGLAIRASANKSIYIDTNGGLTRWKFAPDGKLVFPDNTEQTTAYSPGAKGQWTVTTGTNTYSFTVDAGATYVMWVRGTTDNGVISWNATVTITNANLPAVGTSGAYVYTGGGTMLDFTTVPDRITTPSSGGISRLATILGAPSTEFNFGINNASGASVTVYWGWTKI